MNKIELIRGCCLEKMKDIAEYVCFILPISQLNNTQSIYKYAKTFYIKIHKYKEKVIKLLKEAKWQELYPMTATPNLLQWQVYKYLKEKIPELE